MDSSKESWKSANRVSGIESGMAIDSAVLWDEGKASGQFVFTNGVKLHLQVSGTLYEWSSAAVLTAITATVVIFKLSTNVVSP